MKKLIFLELILLFLATNFQSDNPPGWYQQPLPVNDLINDIFFLDSLNGWVVTNGQPNINDSAYIMRSTNGGQNWQIQLSNLDSYNAIQFLDENTGYVAAGWNVAKILKTTNGGVNWFEAFNFGLGFGLNDIDFINKDTGWVCADDFMFGGLWKTTDGGLSWQMQLSPDYEPLSIFFINKDTGWVGCIGDVKGRLYNTTNGGMNWNLQFISVARIDAIYFLTPLKGWIHGGTPGTNGVAYTTDGGQTWTNGQGEIGGYDVKFVNDSIGYAGGGSQPLRILKSTNGGKVWGYQNAQATPDISVSTLIDDTLLVWAGKQILIKTTDGGGNIVEVQQMSSEIPADFRLYQNYPNPFNPKTIFKFQISRSSDVRLVIYDLSGKLISTIINQKLSPGVYEESFDSKNLSSGVYFYSLIADGIIIDTKKMVLIR